jgi:hypothetical protein
MVNYKPNVNQQIPLIFIIPLPKPKDFIVGLKINLSKMQSSRVDDVINSAQRSRILFDHNSYYVSSERKSLPPKVLHEFFHDHPVISQLIQFERYEQDRSRLKQLAQQAPREGSARKYIVVDEQVQEGRPISKEELANILARRANNPEVVTYGLKTPQVVREKTPLLKNQPQVEEKFEKYEKVELDVQPEGKPRFMGCC